MCRLLGIIANKAVDINYSAQRFEPLADADCFGRQNPDGWGIGYYEANCPVIKKEPLHILDSDKSYQIFKRARSKVFLSHLRLASPNIPITKEDTHPFNSDQWIFAHNGTIREPDRSEIEEMLDPQWKEKIKGKTDSEIYFYWLLQNTHNEEDPISGIKKALKELYTRDYSSLNFILTNGHMLIAHCAYNEDGTKRMKKCYTLHYLSRDPTNDYVEYKSEENVKIMLGEKAERLEKAVLICSEPLSSEKWKPMPNRSLLVISSDLSCELIPMD
jgi:glutamine amidotransferase